MSINFTLSGFKTLGYSLMAGSIERIGHYFCSSLSAHVKSMEIKSKDEPLPNNILKTEKKWLVTLDFYVPNTQTNVADFNGRYKSPK